MTTIFSPFSFSITLHKKSHFLAFLLIMNCTVLCPIGPLLPEAKNPPQRNNVDVSLTDRELTLIMQWEIHFQKEGSSVWWKTRRLLHMRLNARAMQTKQQARICAHTDTSTNTDVISGQSLWEYITSCCGIIKELCNMWPCGAADWASSRPSITAFLPAGG